MTKLKSIKRKLKRANKALARFNSLDKYVQRMEDKGDVRAISFLESKQSIEEQIKQFENDISVIKTNKRGNN